MLKTTLALVILFMAAGAANAAASDIPSQFRGKWGSPSACKTIAGGGESDGITEVNVRAINQYETGCNLVSGHLAGANVYAGSFECSVEGNTSSSPINLKLVNGKLGVNGNKPLTRCAA
ncbi:hypothetical protein [Caballeronia grimmiae]|uniref:hypothetical protein n=1 Tax=Caballeronia grimmiae TaxID=1071679 RepID=UPI0038BDAA38